MALDAVAARYMNNIGDHHAGSDNTRRLVALLVNHFGPAKLLSAITHDDVTDLIARRRKDKVPHTARTISKFTVNDTTEQLKKLFTFEKARGAQRTARPTILVPGSWFECVIDAGVSPGEQSSGQPN